MRSVWGRRIAGWMACTGLYLIAVLLLFGFVQNLEEVPLPVVVIFVIAQPILLLAEVSPNQPFWIPVAFLLTPLAWGGLIYLMICRIARLMHQA